MTLHSTMLKLNNDTHRYQLGLILFWFGVFILNAGPHWEVYSSTRELLETAGVKTSLQLLVAFVTLTYLLPVLLDRGRWLLFVVLVFALVVVVAEINIVIRYCYLEVLYPDSYKRFLASFSHMTLMERMDLGWALRYILFTKLPQLTFPTVLIAAYQFYQKQQTLLKIKEQKISAELDALKSQLNPHFIFNTLNNIYSLAIKKSDQTPIAIEKLSAILDYVVYRCTGKFVPLQDEVELIQNYIDLEKLRYGKRLNFSAHIDVKHEPRIAPLILLTLIENACKHSTKEEINQSSIQLEISEQGSMLNITVSNSKPNTLPADRGDNKVGLINLRKQLELLYPSKHSITISDEENQYTTQLNIDTDSVHSDEAR